MAPKGFDLNRLYSQLLNTGLQQKDPPLYQVINLLIGALQQILVQTANGSSGSSPSIINNQITQIIGLIGEDGSIGEDGAPGPAGARGSSGINGAAGPMGAILYPPDAEDGDVYPPIVGPQGNPGPTGSQGPLGVSLFPFDGNDGEDGLTIPGLPGVSSAPTNAVLYATVNITDAEFRSLNTVPKQIIAAPGANKVIVPLYFSAAYNITSVFSAGPAMNLRYTTSSLATGMTAVNTGANSTGKRYLHSSGSQTALGGTTGYDNNALEVFNSASCTGGVTSGGFNVYVWYIIIDVP